MNEATETTQTVMTVDKNQIRPDLPPGLNWEQRKARDRNRVNLAEKILRLSKNTNLPCKEKIVSFLASLNDTQYEFLDQIFTSLTCNIEPELNVQTDYEPTIDMAAQQPTADDLLLEKSTGLTHLKMEESPSLQSME